VWFYELGADGFSLDDKRSPVSENDIPDILESWSKRSDGSRCFQVDADRIAANGWQLMPGRYKPLQFDAQIHDPPSELLREVIDLETLIAKNAKALLERIGDSHE
jgi:type I restriction enzyme M protein